MVPMVIGTVGRVPRLTMPLGRQGMPRVPIGIGMEGRGILLSI